MIGLAQMLEEGFECAVPAADGQSGPVEFALKSDQRAQLISFEQPRSLWHRIAGAGAAAAGVTLLFGHFGRVSDSASKVAEVSTQVSRFMAAAVSPDAVSLAAPLANIASFVEETNWMPVMTTEDPMVCTPPTLKDMGASGLSPDDV